MPGEPEILVHRLATPNLIAAGLFLIDFIFRKLQIYRNTEQIVQRVAVCPASTQFPPLLASNVSTVYLLQVVNRN